MKEILKKYFGYSTFRPYQEEIIQHVLGGNHAVVIMPTGGGKSLCFQLTAMQLSGMTIVVSPLISLMKDQVDSLKASGINAACLNSSLDYAEVQNVENDCKKGKIKLLYIAPERFSSERFQSFLNHLEISLIAVDEAHCISQWGHDFRPDYRNLNQLIHQFENVPIIALTATATPQVQADIVEQLSLKEYKSFITGFDRPNLSIQVRRKKKTKEKLISLLKEYSGESVIIYCFSRKETEELASKMREEGFVCAPYHAGLSNEERKTVQEHFVNDTVNIIIATIAFGMGIDKPDVRLVVHYTFPKSLEGYYQEIGRAGRDGLEAQCVLFYSYGDKLRHDFFLKEKELDQKELEEQKLNEVIRFCELSTCRRLHLLHYFGEKSTKNCENCDVCTRTKESFDATIIAQKILSAVIRTGGYLGKTHIINVLKGSRNQKILAKNHDKLSVHGIAKEESTDMLNYVFTACYDRKLLQKNNSEYPTFDVSVTGKKFLYERERLYLPKLIEEEKTPQLVVSKSFDQSLFEGLRIIRKELAQARSVPPFMIFGDRTLQEIATHLPKTKEEFSRLHGVGAKKLEEFSDIFIREVINYCKETEV